MAPRHWSEIAVGAVLATVAGIVLAGWVVGSQRMVAVCGGCAAMVPNTAIGFLIMASALLFPRLRWAASVSLIVFGVLVMAEYALAVNLGIDTIVLRPWYLVGQSSPGRMAPGTACSFILAGAVPHLYAQRQALAVLGLFGSAPTLILYALHSEVSPVAAGATVMALPTAGLWVMFWCYVLIRREVTQ
jgi:hypothetical protein